jgi:RecA-family ATPase
MTDEPFERIVGLTDEEPAIFLDQAPPFDDVPLPDGPPDGPDSTSGEQKSESRRLPPLDFVNMCNWDNVAVPEREWAVRNRIPIRQVTINSGEGAVGKSIVELQLAAAHALGKDWLGSLPEPGPAIYLGAEDDVPELHRRLADVCNLYNAKFADLISGGFNLLSHVEGDALLGVPDSCGQIVPTQLYYQLLEAARDIKPKHIGIDTLADVFGGNEIDRVQVRQFVTMLRKLAIAANGSVVLLAHPSQSGINSGSGLSGSTAWHNSVRGRFYMVGDGDDEDVRTITFMKNQYGRKDNRVKVRYRNGVFIPDNGQSEVQRAAQTSKIDEAFLRCLAVKTDQGVYISSKESRSGAGATFAKMPEAEGITAKAFYEAQERLLSLSKIRVEPYGSPSDKKFRIVLIGL